MHWRLEEANGLNKLSGFILKDAKIRYFGKHRLSFFVRVFVVLKVRSRFCRCAFMIK